MPTGQAKAGPQRKRCADSELTHRLPGFGKLAGEKRAHRELDAGMIIAVLTGPERYPINRCPSSEWGEFSRYARM